MTEKLLWVDLETTGLDEQADWILEVGAVVTEAVPPFDEVATFSALVKPATPHWKDRMGARVVEMHARSGLLADVEAKATASIAEVDRALVEVLKGTGAKKHDFMLAGSGVAHFDSRFIARQMPETAAWIRYPVLDVGVLRRALIFAGRGDLTAAGTTYAGDAFADKPHRGLADVMDHLAEFRRYAHLFTLLPETRAAS
jgi:oligoribonuclease